MKELIIIRGLPGSGKTTFASKLADGAQIEADTFFIQPSGAYQYDGSKITQAHMWCQNAVGHAMLNELEKIVVSNTFVKRWMMKPYYDMAKQHGYQVTEITMSGPLYGSTHNVPLEIIYRMRDDWEI